MDLLAHLRMLRRRWRLPLVGLVLGVVLGGLSGMAGDDPPTYYRATHTLAAFDDSVNLHQAAALTTTGQVPDRVAAKLGVPSGGLRGQITATVKDSAGLLDLTAIGVDPSRTTMVADTVATELSAYMTESTAAATEGEVTRLENQIARLTQEMEALQAGLPFLVDQQEILDADAAIAALRSQINSLQGDLATARSAEVGSALQTVSPANAVAISGPQFNDLFRASEDVGTAGSSSTQSAEADAAISPSREIGMAPRIAVGGLVGLAIGVVGAFVLERLDPRLRSKEQTEAVFGWPVLVEVPSLTKAQQRDHTILAYEAPRSRGAEAYRGLRSSVLFALRATGSPELVPRLPEDPDDASHRSDEVPSGRVVLVTSPSPAEGKTTTAGNLATVLGEAGHRVLVMNCDFRRPKLGRYLGIEETVPHVVPTDLPGVHLLAQVSDDPDLNPAEVIATQLAAIEEARKRFDVVVLDTAPLLTTNDANEVLDAADLIVVVARAGRTTTEAADRCAEQFERRNAPVLGVVLLAATDAPMGRHYYYGDYYLDETIRRPLHINDHATAPPSDEVPASSGGESTRVAPPEAHASSGD